MSYTLQLIDQLKAAKNLESDYAIAKLLGLRPSRISNYRTNTSHADDKTAVMLAEALGLDPFTTIARINEDRATDRKDKAFWRRLSAAAAVVLCVVSLPSLSQEDAVGAFALLNVYLPIHYAKLTMAPKCLALHLSGGMVGLSEGQRCPNDCAKQLYDRVIYNHTPLWVAWAGFRMADRELVASMASECVALASRRVGEQNASDRRSRF